MRPPPPACLSTTHRNTCAALRRCDCPARNWQGVPLETLEIVVNLIAATRTTTGLEVHAWLDEKDYPPKIKVSDVDLEAVNIHRNKFHGEWNYEIRPQA